MMDLQWLHNHPTEVFECIAKLEAENKELKAQVEQLRGGLNQAIELLVTALIEPQQITDKEISELRGIEQSTPAQCLAARDAEIKAQAVYAFAENVISHFDGCNYNLTRETLKCYIHDQLRQQANSASQ